MLNDLLGIRLLLLVGDTLPLPPPPGVLEALEEVEVTNDARDGDGFRLTFKLTKGPLLDYSLVQSGAVAPMKRVVIAAVFGVLPQVLLDGIVTHHQLQPGNEPGEARLTVMGRDLSVLMGLKEKNERFPNQPDFVIFTRIIGQYAQYGLIPAPTPTPDLPIELERVPRQQETDLAFVQRMAQRNGYVFYVQPVTVGVNTAYFGPEVRVGLPQPALTTDMGAATNVTSLSFQNDALAPVGTEGTFVEPFFKTALPIPSLPSLKIPPLALQPATPQRTVLARDTANQNPATAAVNLLARQMNAPDAVTASGQLDAARYGHALRARGLVGVRGAGLSYDGFYYVRRVTHTLKPGQYTQSFTLSREGTGPTLPVVIP